MKHVLKARTISTLVTAILALTAVYPGFGADHLDSPIVVLPADVDITDVYIFHPGSPQDRSKTVLVLNVNPLTPRGLRPVFSSEAVYELKIDNDGDAIADIVFRVKFSSPNNSGVQQVILRMAQDNQAIRGNGGMTIATGTTESIIPVSTGGRLFAGLRDDPFFFDLISFRNSLSFCGTDPSTDTFRQNNVSSIVLEVPTALLGTSVGVWGAIKLPDENGDFVQADRMGRPAVNTVFIPSSKKALFNAGEPTNDRTTFKADVVATLIALGNDPATANALADVLLPDILTVDLQADTGFLNGRNLSDDVIDAELALISGGAITKDCVYSNDVAFLSMFPYLAGPHLA